MAYETRYGSESYTYYVTNSRRVYTGFEDATRARAKFIFFKCEGLTPNTRHFFFFDNKNVTNYISTDSVNAPDDYYTLPRNYGFEFKVFRQKTLFYNRIYTKIRTII